MSGALGRLEAVVRGHVQGVGFRYFVQRRAMRLGLVGWVANDLDGSVRCVAEGAPESLEALLDALRKGPPGSIVKDVDLARSTASGAFDRFSIRPSGHRGD